MAARPAGAGPPGLAVVLAYRPEELGTPGLPLGAPAPHCPAELDVLRHEVRPWDADRVRRAAAEALGSGARRRRWRGCTSGPAAWHGW
ncbi:hypothetical protein DN402_18580 [Streptomyces sp. SW4]|nr:hypothetical protein DN402_18580 [Streptomyces sp. SW4]